MIRLDSLGLLLGRLGRDWRGWLFGFSLLFSGFGLLWALVMRRTLEQVAPFFRLMASQSGLGSKDIESVVFEGPGKVLRTLIGGERVNLENAMDVLSVALVHPLMVGLAGLWALGRGTALLGELDRGTLELLLSQPVSRRMVAFAHTLFDAICWPLLGLAFTCGMAAGVWWIDPIVEKPLSSEVQSKMQGARPWWLRLDSLLKTQTTQEGANKRLELRPLDFLKAAPVVAGLGFALSGLSFGVAAFGRSRFQMLGLLATCFFMMYLANLLAQLYEPMGWVRPLTVFYYYHPQEVALGLGGLVSFNEWGLQGVRLPGLAVLVGLGVVGYGCGTWQMVRRDLPVPL